MRATCAQRPDAGSKSRALPQKAERNFASLFAMAPELMFSHHVDMTQYLLTKEEVVRACDDLHSYMDRGPGPNTDALADSLTTLRRLQSAASWDYPLELLTRIESQLMLWFSEGANGGPARQALLDHMSRLEDAWERPRA
jgi:hypothetical protein